MFGKIGNIVATSVIALLVLVLMMTLGWGYFNYHLVGAIIFGMVTLLIYALLYAFKKQVLDFLEWIAFPAFWLGAILVWAYWGFLFLVWLYNAALVPTWFAYVALVAGVMAGNAASVAALGLIVAIVVIMIVVWIVRRR